MPMTVSSLRIKVLQLIFLITQYTHLEISLMIWLQCFQCYTRLEISLMIWLQCFQCCKVLSQQKFKIHLVTIQAFKILFYTCTFNTFMIN